MKKILKRSIAMILSVLMLVSFPITGLAATSTKSSFTGKTYTHSTAFDDSTVLNGIDVSSHNGTIDWQKVKKSGVDFAMIRVGFTGYTKSKHSINADTSFKTNIEGATAAGIPVGVYYYSQAINFQEALDEVSWFLSRIKDYKITLPVVCDYEFAGQPEDGRLDTAWSSGAIDEEDMTYIAKTFCQVIKNNGYDAAFYSNKSFLTHNVAGDALGEEFKIWLAHYTTKTDYKGNYTMWQYTESGTVDGINGIVDCNFLYQPQGVSDEVVTNLKASTAQNALTLSCDALNGAVSYEFQVKKNGSWVSATSKTPSAQITGLASGTEYEARVRANVFGAYTGWTTASFFTKPAKVTGLYTSARGGTGNTLRISWDAQKDADGYNVYRKESGKYVFKGTTAKNEYTFEDMVPGWEYYFRVTAYKGDPSNAGYGSDEFHTCAACPPMDAPTVSPAGSNSIKVDWNIVNSHGYVIQWSTDSTFSKDLNSLYVTGHNWDSYTITTKGNARNYYVRVRAWRNFEGGMVYGVWSSGSKISSDIPDKVTGLATTGRGNGGYSLKIGWNAQSDADSYNIYSYSKTKGWTKAATTKNNYYVFEDVVPGWEYNYKVAAVKNGREGELSDQLHTCAACPDMKAPNLTKEGLMTTTIRVNWEIVNSHGYVVQWSKDPQFKTGVTSVYVTGHNQDTYNIKTISTYDKHYVRVRAWRNFEGGMVYGSWSEASKTVIEKEDAEWVQREANAYIQSRGIANEPLTPDASGWSGKISTVPFTSKYELLEYVKGTVDFEYQDSADAGNDNTYLNLYVYFEPDDDGSYLFYVLYL